MTDQEKLALLEDMLEVEEGSLSSDLKLEDIEEWDSVAIISFMALVDEEFDKTLKASDIKEFKTIADTLAVMEA